MGENLSSFSRSDRGLYLYPADSLASGAIASTNLDVSPSTLIPYYDPDTSVVILTGKVSTQNNCVWTQTTDSLDLSSSLCF